MACFLWLLNGKSWVMKTLKMFGLIVLMALFFNHHSFAQVEDNSSNVTHKTAPVADTTKKKSKPVKMPNKKKRRTLLIHSINHRKIERNNQNY